MGQVRSSGTGQAIPEFLAVTVISGLRFCLPVAGLLYNRMKAKERQGISAPDDH